MLKAVVLHWFRCCCLSVNPIKHFTCYFGLRNVYKYK